MTIKQAYPTRIEQTTGGKFRKFRNLFNLKTNANIAITEAPVEGKPGGKTPHNSTKIQPSTISVTNFKLNIPQYAKIKKITAYYRHAKTKTSKNAKHICNIGAPKINIVRREKNGTYSQLRTAKGSAPTETAKTHSVSFNVKGTKNQTPLSREVMNSADFGVEIEYPKNSNYYEGYVVIKYLMLQVEYVEPSFGLSVKKVSGGYNQEPIQIEAVLANKNLTSYVPTVTILAPPGVSFTKAVKTELMMDKVVKINARTCQWIPAFPIVDGYEQVKRGSCNVILEFLPELSFPSNVDSETLTFQCNVNWGNINKTLNVTITKKPPSEDIDDSGNNEEEPTDKQISIEEQQFQIFDMVLDQPYEVTITTLNDPTESVSERAISENTNYGAVVSVGNNNVNHFEFKVDNTVLSPVGGNILIPNNLFVDNSVVLTITPDALHDIICDYDPETGTYSNGASIQDLTWSSSDYESQTYNSYYWFDIRVKPVESDLSLPHYSICALSEEELNRLGDGVNYIFQSDVKLTTNEEYVRNWYKNYRLAVFNNSISENVTEYVNYVTDAISQVRDIDIPSRFVLTDEHTLKLECSNAVQLVIDETEYNLSDNDNIVLSLAEDTYSFAVTFNKDVENETLITATLYDGNNDELFSCPYNVVFNADEQVEPYTSTVDSTNYNELTKQEIISHAAYFGNVFSKMNTYHNAECEFTYNKNYPLFLLIIGDYVQGDENNVLSFKEPCIIESDNYTQRLPNGNFPFPIKNLIAGEGESAETTIETNQSSNAVVIYDFPLDSGFSTSDSMAIRGIQLSGTVEQTDEIVISAKLKSPNGNVGTRSIVLDDYQQTNEDSSFTIGANGDLWGFTTLDMIEFEKWELELEAINSLTGKTANLNFGDLQLRIYTEVVDVQNEQVKIEGENLAYYGAFIKNLSIPPGLATDVDYLQVDGTDTNEAHRQTIKEKIIELEFDIGDNCDLTASTKSLQQVTQLLMNERDQYNRPIPKTIEFSHMPGLYAEYIIEDELDAEIEISSYILKAKLTIPSGTFYTTDDIITNVNGFVQGVASISPSLTLTATDETLEVTETVSGQTFNMGCAGITGKIIEIDCEDRKVYLKDDEDDENEDSIDISKYVDFNSDWFVLFGEYNFESVGCVVRKVKRNERW